MGGRVDVLGGAQCAASRAVVARVSDASARPVPRRERSPEPTTLQPSRPLPAPRSHRARRDGATASVAALQCAFHAELPSDVRARARARSARSRRSEKLCGNRHLCRRQALASAVRARGQMHATSAAPELLTAREARYGADTPASPAGQSPGRAGCSCDGVRRLHRGASARNPRSAFGSRCPKANGPEASAPGPFCIIALR